MSSQHAERQPAKVRLVHKLVPGMSLHAYTSPDLKGFYVTSRTRAGARREARDMLKLIFSRRGSETPVIQFMETQAA